MSELHYANEEGETLNNVNDGVSDTNVSNNPEYEEEESSNTVNTNTNKRQTNASPSRGGRLQQQEELSSVQQARNRYLEIKKRERVQNISSNNNNNNNNNHQSNQSSINREKKDKKL